MPATVLGAWIQWFIRETNILSLWDLYFNGGRDREVRNNKLITYYMVKSALEKLKWVKWD